MKRRYLLKRSTLAFFATGLLRPVTAFALSSWQKVSGRYLRPPGALDEEEFLKTCINCGQCGEICPNDCIGYFSAGDGLAVADTPYITPRSKACILCMKCGDVCPTGAIQPIKRSFEEIVTKVDMGKARVDTNLCLSYQGKTCGVCYRSCPLPDVALRVQRLEQPVVMDQCVGCGLCERSCIQIPQAIKIIPKRMLTSS